MNTIKAAQELFIYMSTFMKGPAQKMHDISQGEMAALLFLTMEKQETTPTELSEKLNLSTARIANTLNSLEKKKLIERKLNSVDRRKVIVYITKLGKQRAENNYQEAIESLKSLLIDLGEEDAAHILRIFKKIAALIKEHNRN